MWLPPINFVTVHYAYIILIGLSAFLIIFPDGAISAVNAYHFGVSASTESGLNTVDLKDLKTYQQVYLYIIPVITNIGFINIVVVVVRLWWFRKHLEKLAPAVLRAKQREASNRDTERDAEDAPKLQTAEGVTDEPRESDTKVAAADAGGPGHRGDQYNQPGDEEASQGQTISTGENQDENGTDDRATSIQRRITFDATADQHPKNDSTLYIPGPRDRDRGHPLIELSRKPSVNSDGEEPPPPSQRRHANYA